MSLILAPLLTSVFVRTSSYLKFTPDLGIILVAIPMMTWLKDRFRQDHARNKTEEPPVVSPMSARERALKRQVEHLRSLLRIIANLSATLEYERVLEMALDLGISAFNEAGSSVGRIAGALMLFNGDHLYVAAARGLTHADQRTELAGEEGVIEEALGKGRTRITGNPAGDPELQRLVAMHACKVAVCIPLIVGLEAYGVLLFGHPEKDFFSEDRLEILETIAKQAIIALQNAKLYRDLEQEKERMVEIQEETRKKLARDLHDGPTQSVGAIAMRVNFARRLVARDPNAASEELFKIEELARRTTKEIRQMLFTLRPLVLESEGLVPAIEQLAVKMRENHNQNVIVEAQSDVVVDLEVGKQGVIFFIVDEAVNNARKHAEADHIWVRLQRKGDLILLEVEDDGVGFDRASIEQNYNQRGSLGMVNLRERAELVSGLLRIDSSEGKGTRVMVTIPISIEAAEKLHRTGYVA